MTKQNFFDITKYLAKITANSIYDGAIYVVGGCCRDMFLGKDPKDIDLVVSLPDGGTTLADWLFENGYLVNSPVKFTSFGTSMFKLKEFPDIELEAVQTRNEEYVDRNSRKPATKFGTIKEDCMRRDLTINAIYYNIASQSYIDVCGNSIEDLNKHIIRTPDDPNITYMDDPLRILRCVRFACRYGWPIENKTFEGMKNNISRLSIVSRERIMSEFEQIVMSPNYTLGMKLLYELKAMNYIIPNFWKTSENNIPTYNQDLDPIMYLENKTLAKIYMFLTKNIHQHVLYVLKFDTKFIRQIEDLKRVFNNYKDLIYNKWDSFQNLDDKVIREMQYLCKSEEVLYDVLDCINADWYGKITSIIDAIKESTEKMIKNGTSMFDYKLPINGDDIMELGIPAGKLIRDIQNTLRNLAFADPTITKTFCITYIKIKFMNNNG